MPRLRRCWVPRCPNNNALKAQNTRLFKFPLDVERCMRWLKAIGDESLAYCPWKVLVTSRFVCREHFMPHMISATNRALCNAFPLLFTDVRPELPDTALRTFLDNVPANRCPSPSDGATVLEDFLANRDPPHPQDQEPLELQEHSPFADTHEDSNEFNLFGGEENIKLEFSETSYPRDQDTPDLQEHSPVAEGHEDSEEVNLFLDSAIIDHDYFSTSVPRKLQAADSAIIDHDYFSTSVPRNLQAAGNAKTYQKLNKNNNNQENLLAKKRKLETLKRELCRLCGQRGSVLTPLFETTLDPTMDVSVASKIDMYLPIKVKLDDALPLCICSNCLTVLNQWHELYSTSVAADGVLLKIFGVDPDYGSSILQMTTVNNPCIRKVQQNAETQTQELKLKDAETQTEPSGALTDKTQTNAPISILRAELVLFNCSKANKNAETQTEGTPAGALVYETETYALIHKAKTNAVPDETRTNSLTEETPAGDLRAESLTVEMPSDPLTNETKENNTYSRLGSRKTGILHEDKLSLFEFLHKCRFCSDYFADSADYRSHLSLCRQLSTICELCGLEVSCRKQLRKHKYQKHNAAAPRKYLCDKCHKFYNSIPSLRSHQKTIHGAEDRSKKYCCELCGGLFTREIYYQTHKRKHEMGKVKTLFQIENFRQEVNSEGSESGVIYVCPVCQEMFNDMRSLAFHLTEKKKLKCSSCRKVVYSEKSIFLHVCEQWTCQYCSKSFDQRVKWLIHERGHTGEKPVKCRKCDKTFRKWQTRNDHEARHEPMPHLCTYCGKRFRKKSVFRDHVLCHEGKKFLCHICNKKFSGRRSLNKHHSTVHKGLKKAVCSNE